MEDNAVKILPNLWLGNYYSSQDIYFLKNNNIRNIINVTPNFPNYFQRKINYLNIPIKDNKIYHEIFIFYIPYVLQYIEQSLNNNEGILIHCKKGHKRSAVYILLYLCYKYNLTKKQSKDYIKSIRPLALHHNSLYLKQYYI
jgi:protein-tyrosine phosphatase